MTDLCTIVELENLFLQGRLGVFEWSGGKICLIYDIISRLGDDLEQSAGLGVVYDPQNIEAGVKIYCWASNISIYPLSHQLVPGTFTVEGSLDNLRVTMGRYYQLPPSRMEAQFGVYVALLETIGDTVTFLQSSESAPDIRFQELIQYLQVAERLSTYYGPELLNFGY